MQIREISKPVTAKSLNESLAKRFGQKIKIESFTLEQLQDARNKIRTKLSQVETNESFDSVQDETYQKSKLFLDVLNAAISEREDVGVSEKKQKDWNKDGKNDWEDVKAARMAAAAKAAGKKEKTNERVLGNPDEEKAAFLRMYKDAIKKNDKVSAMLIAGVLMKEYGIDVNKTSQEPTQSNVGGTEQRPGEPVDGVTKGFSSESVIREGEEDKAELVMAAKDMVDKVTGWMEDTAEMQTESMLELADAIRDEHGSAISEQFTASVKPALESMYAAMESTRITLTQGVGMLTGESGAPMMGDEAALEPADVDVDGEMADADAAIDAAQDEFGADAAAAGGEEEAGRLKRESKAYSKKKIAETSRRLAATLSKKKT